MWNEHIADTHKENAYFYVYVASLSITTRLHTATQANKLKSLHFYYIVAYAWTIHYLYIQSARLGLEYGK